MIKNKRENEGERGGSKAPCPLTNRGKIIKPTRAIIWEKGKKRPTDV